jgi:hypothetical protein
VKLSLPNADVKATDLNIYFSDHREVRWRRGVFGSLTEAPDPALRGTRDGLRLTDTGTSDAPNPRFMGDTAQRRVDVARRRVGFLGDWPTGPVLIEGPHPPDRLNGVPEPHVLID